MLLGSVSVMRAGINDANRAADLALNIEDPDYLWLAERISMVMGRMMAANSHVVLRQHGLSDAYLREFARTGILELWGPQMEAIDKGLLDQDHKGHFVITIPTGAGKTLIAELAIAKALQNEENGWAIYVAPSRALVNQVSNDLRRRLPASGINVRTVLAGAEQSVLLDDELEMLTSGKTVTVITPEKLDAYYRNAREIFNECKVAVFDEIHKISDEDRGLLLESLVTRFLVLQTETQLILLSGVMSNYDELANWLGSETRTVIARRRPGRQVRSIAVRHSLQPRGPRNRDGASTRRVDFHGGLALVHEEEDIEVMDRIEMQIPAVFEGYFTEESRSRGAWERWYENRKRARSKRNEHAADIAGSLLRGHAASTVLVFCQTTLEAESSCRNFNGAVSSEFRTERNQLAAFLRAELGDAHNLAGFVLEGKAYHHARMPPSVQRAIELGLEEGWIKIVFATATLREGINSPASVVIIAGDSYYDEAKEELVELAEADFENIAGRAGRPFRETEGVIVLVPNNLATASSIGGKYLLVGHEALRARSQLQRLAGVLGSAREDLTTLSAPVQRLILGLKAAGLESEQKLGDFFEQTLWAVQEQDDDLPSVVAFGTSETLIKTGTRIGDDRLVVAAKTGFSLSSVETILSRLALDSRVYSLGESIGLEEPLLLGQLLDSVARLPEVTNGYLRRTADWQRHVGPLMNWINGVDYEGIRRSSVESGVMTDTATLGEAVKYAADLSTWLSWGFGACALLLQSTTPEINPWVASLPWLVKYGVPTLEAAYVSMLGVSDRATAQMLAAKYRETGGERSINAIATWMESLDDELESIFQAEAIRLELVRRQVFRRRAEEIPYMFVRADVKYEVTPGDVLTIEDDEDRVVLKTRRGQRVGELANVPLVRRFARGRPEELAAVIAGPVRNSQVPVSLVRLRLSA
jgi:hypothetical protein